MIVLNGSNRRGHGRRLVLVGAVAWAFAAGGCGASDEVEAPTPGERRIVSLSLAGSLSCAGQPPVNFSFAEGAAYAALRGALLDPRNFGPQGVVPVTFVLRPAIHQVRPRSLGRADVLVVNNASAPIDQAALATIEAFVAGGGSVISVGDEVSTFLAKKGECVSDPDAQVAGNGAASSIVDGPFGRVIGAVATGYNCAFSELRAGVAVLAQNDKGPSALVLDAAATDTRAGRAVAFGDDEIFSSLTAPPCGSGKLAPGSANETLALNTFAFLALARPSDQ